MADPMYPEYEGINEFIEAMFRYARVTDPYDCDNPIHECAVISIRNAADSRQYENPAHDPNMDIESERAALATIDGEDLDSAESEQCPKCGAPKGEYTPGCCRATPDDREQHID